MDGWEVWCRRLAPGTTAQSKGIATLDPFDVSEALHVGKPLPKSREPCALARHPETFPLMSRQIGNGSF